VERAFAYLGILNLEKKRVETNIHMSRTSLAVYDNKVIANRSKNTRIAIGEMAKAHMNRMRGDLAGFFEQAGFIRYEMINGQKEQLRKKIAGKEMPKQQIDGNLQREFYVQNGYEYWPFDGEYWLDEIGNYHYLGQQSCE
jgi:hypothetical protein